MSKCIRCGGDTLTSAKICRNCMNNWADMRSAIFNALQEKYGTLSPINHRFFIKETKRLESIWRKDKQKFQVELSKI